MGIGYPLGQLFCRFPGRNYGIMRARRYSVIFHHAMKPMHTYNAKARIWTLSRPNAGENG